MDAANRPPQLVWVEGPGRLDKREGGIIIYNDGKSFMNYVGFSARNIVLVANAMKSEKNEAYEDRNDLPTSPETSFE